MSFQTAKPSSILSQYVKQYWAIEDCLPAGKEHIQRIVPNGLMELMFYSPDRPTALDENKQLPENTILCGQQKSYEINRIINSVALINRSNGTINVAALSSAACLSRKQYERTFAEYIGSSPKQFLRTVRFQNTLREKQRNKCINLTALAYSCGYYDQSHMINDYKLLSGKTPAQYFSECDPYSDYFQ